MEKKLSVAEFATLVGTTSKTIYERIKRNSELPLEEQLITVDEKVKGRSVTLISTNTQQIDVYKNIYGKNSVINGEYYEILTDNESSKPVINANEPVKINNDNTSNGEVINRLLTLNEDNNHRILQLTDELITAKQSKLLLEDKAGREGLYIKEINDLKTQLITDNKRNQNLIKMLLTVSITLFIVIIMLLTWFITVKHLENSYEKMSNFNQNLVEKIE